MSKTIIERLGEPLKKEDVELRIGTTSQNGFSLLLYKTARVDNKRLNDVCGLDWQERFYLDEHGNRCCELKVWNDARGEWIVRSNVGMESNTEKEKGSYSDAKKRAGFELGIGAELYNAPFVWVGWEMKKVQRGNREVWEPVKFYPSNLHVSDYKVADGHYMSLAISYEGRIIFKMKERPAAAHETISFEQTNKIMKGLAYYGVDAKALIKEFGLSVVKDLSAADFEKAQAFIKSAATKNKDDKK